MDKSSPPATVTVVIGGAILAAAITISAIVVVVIARPEANKEILTLIVGVSSPIILMLLSIGLQGIHRLVNSNLLEVKAINAALLEKVEALQNRAILVAENSSVVNVHHGALAAQITIPEQTVDASAILKEPK